VSVQVQTWDRLRTLERQQQQAAGYEASWENWTFIMAPTCPPSTSVHVRGGWLHNPTLSGYGYSSFVPDQTLTLNRYSIYVDQYEPYFFSAAGNYLPLVVVFSVSWEDDAWSFYPYLWNPRWLNGYPDANVEPVDWQDYASYLEAEQLIDNALSDVVGAFGGVVMGGAILRNNGNLDIGDPWQVLPVDPLNRGRSYLYRDLRQRYLV
jgi:hypothetical protein